MFGIIAADPPWTFGDGLSMSRVKRGASANYRTMDAWEIAALEVRAVAAEDAVLALWYPPSMPLEAVVVARAWGFEPKQTWTWVKTGQTARTLDPDPVPEDLPLAFGMGRLARNCAEPLLVCTRGKPYRHLRDRAVRSVFLAPAGAHSVKPEIVQDALDRMFPDSRKLEMFARRRRTAGKWLCVGNEAPATEGQDIRETLAFLRSRLQAGG